MADSSSIHTVRWVNALANKGHKISLITQHNKGVNSFNDNVNIYELPIKNSYGYYLNYPIAKFYIRKIKPDIINTHYASGYGTLSRLVNFTPTLLSVWGSDVYDFPYRSNIKKKILIKNLNASTEIASTSYAMKNQIEKFVDKKKINITPFGIDLNKFYPNPKKDSDVINIGIIKNLEPVYGVEYLIRAFKLLIDKIDSNKNKRDVNLIIVGTGKQENYLKQLTINLNIKKYTNFVGAVSHDYVPELLNTFDIFCAPSIRESFGVAVIEASACELPVIVSDVGGLTEIVDHGKTGFVVSSKDVKGIGERLYELTYNKEKRELFGKNGRKKVEKLYNWSDNVSKMEKIYSNIIS